MQVGEGKGTAGAGAAECRGTAWKRRRGSSQAKAFARTGAALPVFSGEKRGSHGRHGLLRFIKR